VTMQPVCDLCGNPTDGYVCQRCSDETRRYLQHVVDLAGEVETNVARLARYAVRGGHRAADVDDGPIERQANGLRPTPLPVDLNASARAAHAFNAVTTWARTVEKDRGCTVPAARVAEHPAAVAARFLLQNLDWIRHQPFADEANEQLRAAGAVVRRIVDRPPDEEIVGVCDCGLYLYARRGAATVRCRCDLVWDVKDSRLSLMDALRDRLVTVAEAATLGALAFPDLQRKKARNLVQSWVRTDRPNHLIGSPSQDGPVYPFGEILDRLSRCVVPIGSHDRANVSA
jgi:Domain of unknown function (DUF1922)